MGQRLCACRRPTSQGDETHRPKTPEPEPGISGISHAHESSAGADASVITAAFSVTSQYTDATDFLSVNSDADWREVCTDDVEQESPDAGSHPSPSGRLHGNALPSRDAHHHASANSRAAERLQRYLQLEPTSTRSSTRHGGGRSPVRSVRVPSPTRAADQGFGHRTTSTRSHGVAEVLEEIRSAHDAGRVIRASELLQLHSVVAELPAAQLLEAGIDVQQIECEAEAVSEALQSLENSDGWHVTRDDDLQTWYRHERGTSVHSLRFHTQLRHDVQSCLSLVREWDLITSWNHLALDPCVLDAPSTFLCYAYIAQKMPFPMRNFNVTIRAQGFDLADELNSLLILAESVEPEDLPSDSEPLPGASAKRKVIHLLPGTAVKMTPMEPDSDGTPRTDCWLIVHMDPHLPFVPSMLVNFVLSVLTPYLYRVICKVLDESFKDQNAPLPRRIRENQALYKHVVTRLTSTGPCHSNAHLDLTARNNEDQFA